jgi:hypothetical protein
MSRSALRIIGFVASLCVVGLVAINAADPANTDSAETSVEKTAIKFMDAYVAGNWKSVEQHLTSGNLYVYGSDLSEFSSDRAGFKAMFDNDQKLWRAAARFGALSKISSISQRDLTTLFFNRVFEIGGQKLTVRFSTVWRREKGDWKLVQSANAVPTTGQSTADILRRGQR